MADLQELLSQNPELARALWPKWSDYIPHDPTPKQLAFLMLPHLEAFYGGAAGGGKSDALLMAALQYVDVPNYAAILFRKTLTDLQLAGSLIDRSMSWLGGTDAKWNGGQYRWDFPSGAVLQFGYIGETNAESRYQSTEFQFIGFDEVSQHMEMNYLYMFSRLRRLVCSIHKLNEEGEPIYDPDCLECRLRSSVPVRMRAASNPPRAGDPASDGWLLKRFQIKLVGDKYCGTHVDRPYIPAFLTDNPFIDQKSYAKVLGELDPVTREQLLRGDWGVSADGRFRKGWARYYTVSGDYIVLSPNHRGPVIEINKCRMIQTIDPAASVVSGPGDKDIWKRQPSWTVISTFLITPNYDLLWWDMDRFQVEVPDILPRLQQAYRLHKPDIMGIEANGTNIGVYQMAKRMGLPIFALYPRSADKLVRATDAMVRMEQGRVWFPSDNPAWLEACEREVFTWTGHPHEVSDIVDTLAYAAMYVSNISAQQETPSFVTPQVF